MLALFFVSPHDKASSSHLLRPRARKNDDIFPEIIILQHVQHKGDIQVNLRVTFTWMVSLASMHIGGPWRSCFLSVLRYETYV